MSTDPASEQPLRFAYDITVSWPDGRAFTSDSSMGTYTSLRVIASALRSMAEDLEYRADEFGAPSAPS